MNLEKKLYSTDSFVDLEPIIENVEEGISFWGRRYVYIKGEKETFSIDILAKRVLEIMKQKRFEYSNVERNTGKRIASKIDQIYDNNDKKLEKKWFITRFLCYILEQISYINSHSYPPRFDWEEDNVLFKFYTKKQYEETFGSKPPKKMSNTYYMRFNDIGSIMLYGGV